MKHRNVVSGAFWMWIVSYIQKGARVLKIRGCRHLVLFVKYRHTFRLYLRSSDVDICWYRKRDKNNWQTINNIDNLTKNKLNIDKLSWIKLS